MTLFTYTAVANAAPISVTVEFTGEFLRASTVTNNSAPGVVITTIRYSLGTPGVGIGTWDSMDGAIPNIPAGGIPSDFLSDPEFFQTLTFNVSVLPGQSFSEGNPGPFGAPPPFNDFDLIVSLSPLSVSGGATATAAALANGSVTIGFNTGDVLSSPFLNQSPALLQTIVLTGETSTTPTTSVPEPGTLAMFGLGLIRVTPVGTVFAYHLNRQASPTRRQ